MGKDLSQAPKIHHATPKSCIYNYEEKPTEYRNYQKFFDNAFEFLTLAQLKTIIVLASIKQNDFSPAEEWMLQHTKLTHAQYIMARKELHNMGWITHKRVRGQRYCVISINFDTIYTYTREQYLEYKSGKMVNTEIVEIDESELEETNNTEPEVQKPKQEVQKAKETNTTKEDNKNKNKNKNNKTTSWSVKKFSSDDVDKLLHDNDITFDDSQDIPYDMYCALDDNPDSIYASDFKMETKEVVPTQNSSSSSASILDEIFPDSED